jgi:hypothetical protein
MLTIHPRFKEYQSGAVHPLHDGDLIIATLLPVSLRVHIAKLLVYPSGRFEFAEWITGGKNGNGVFHKENGRFDSVAIHWLEGVLQELRTAVQDIPSEENLGPGYDPFAYEDRDRRVLDYRFDGAILSCAMPSARFFDDFGVSPPQRKRFSECFDSIWDLLLAKLEFPHFRPERTGSQWTFPVVGVYESQE